MHGDFLEMKKRERELGLEEQDLEGVRRDDDEMKLEVALSK